MEIVGAIAVGLFIGVIIALGRGLVALELRVLSRELPAALAGLALPLVGAVSLGAGFELRTLVLPYLPSPPPWTSLGALLVFGGELALVVLFAAGGTAIGLSAFVALRALARWFRGFEGI